VADAIAWASARDCGAVVCFCGTVRDHSEDRPGVVNLEYEAYEEYATARMAEVARSVRVLVPQTRRVALLHRVGLLSVTEVSVLVVVSSAHRPEAFDAARYCIDTIKSTVPIWKRETWEDGSDWAQCAHSIDDVARPVVE
jgi:molybdopterin synthase catalytic subunit